MLQEEISLNNSRYWDELCGSSFAQSLGITDSSKESLKKYDQWYFDFYPYLFDHIPFQQYRQRNVLEIGLGYGTVSQRLAEAGANYTGLDIANGPVSMVNHRLEQAGLAGHAVQGSILDPKFAAGSFDSIVAIGCLHHTGNMRLAIDQCWKLLRPGGSLIFMVYYAYSYRRLRTVPTATMRNIARELMGYRGVLGSGDASERAAYDASGSGDAAPHTDWVSIRSMRSLCGRFSKVSARKENIAQEPPFTGATREKLLKTVWPRLFGLDLYVTATK